MTITLNTLGHATLLIVEDGVPLLATDPWVVGSTYWCSWWLEKYPTPEEIELVRAAENVYITHSHPDHFHWESLKHLGQRPILHPSFPGYSLPEFLAQNGFAARMLEPWRWYPLSDRVRIASVPTPIDDSILFIDTPSATVANLNDSTPRLSLLKLARERLLDPDKPVVALKSYAPASAAVATFRGGKRSPLKTKKDYVLTARRLAEALDASHFVPFASQAFFSRRDSRWANEYKVTYEDLREHWGDDAITLCPPFVEMDLADLRYRSSYREVKRSLDQPAEAQVAAREAEEAAFVIPDDFDALFKTYFDEIPPLRVLFRRGVGWRDSTGSAERFYATRTRRVEKTIPPEHDFVLTLPAKVLYECLQAKILTDLGITMFIRVDTRVNLKLTYMAFLLMGLHDYGHFSSPRRVARFLRFYLPLFFPALSSARWARRPPREERAEALPDPIAA